MARQTTLDPKFARIPGTRGLAKLEYEVKQEAAVRLAGARAKECEIAATYRRKFGENSVSALAFDAVIEQFRVTPKGAGAVRRAVDTVSDNLSDHLPKTVDLTRPAVKEHALVGIRWAQRALRNTMTELYGENKSAKPAAVTTA